MTTRLVCGCVRCLTWLCVVVGFCQALPDTCKGEPNGSPLESLPFSLLTTVTMDLRRGRYPTSGRICKPPSLGQRHPYCVAAPRRINAWMLCCPRVEAYMTRQCSPLSPLRLAREVHHANVGAVNPATQSLLTAYLTNWVGDCLCVLRIGQHDLGHTQKRGMP